MARDLFVGMDVGSTTVKAVVVDAATDEILWRDYQRHDTKQPEKVLEFLQRFEPRSTASPRQAPHVHHRLGRQRAGEHLGAKFVQEVNAVSLAVEKLYPECGS
jgi:activator of 2-hydroxyglutaryl-CoA dehydratase